METETLTVLMTTMVEWTGNDTVPADSKVASIKLATKIINILILAFLMVSMGCTIDLKDFKETFRRPAGFFVGMLCQFVLMPLIAFCLGLAFRLEAAGALSLLILACCPGGTLSNIFTYWTGGDVCLSVCMTTISTAVAIGMMPLNLFIYSRMWTSEKAVIPYVNIVTTLVSILIPVAFGVFLRWLKREWMKTATNIGIVVSFMCIISAWILNFLLNPTFLQAVWQLWFCAASLPLLGYFLGYGLAFLLRQSHKKCRTICFETGSQNVSLAMTLTVVTFAESPLFYDMLFYPTLYAFFIYIDSFTVIGIYKIALYLHKKYNPPMAKQMEELSDYDDDGSHDEDVDQDDEAIEKTALKSPEQNQTDTVIFVKKDQNMYQKI